MHICSNKCSCSNKCLPPDLDVKNDDFCPISGTFKASNKHPLQKKKRKSEPILCCKRGHYSVSRPNVTPVFCPLFLNGYFN